MFHTEQSFSYNNHAYLHYYYSKPLVSKAGPISVYAQSTEAIYDVTVLSQINAYSPLLFIT